MLGEAQNPVWVYLTTELNFHPGPEDLFSQKPAQTPRQPYSRDLVNQHPPLRTGLWPKDSGASAASTGDSTPGHGLLEGVGTPKVPQKRDNDTLS